jgi:hypothetical protein
MSHILARRELLRWYVPTSNALSGQLFLKSGLSCYARERKGSCTACRRYDGTIAVTCRMVIQKTQGTARRRTFTTKQEFLRARYSYIETYTFYGIKNVDAWIHTLFLRKNMWSSSYVRECTRIHQRCDPRIMYGNMKLVSGVLRIKHVVHITEPGSRSRNTHMHSLSLLRQPHPITTGKCRSTGIYAYNLYHIFCHRHKRRRTIHLYRALAQTFYSETTQTTYSFVHIVSCAYMEDASYTDAYIHSYVRTSMRTSVNLYHLHQVQQTLTWTNNYTLLEDQSRYEET